MKNVNAASNKIINSRFLFLFFLSGAFALILPVLLSGIEHIYSNLFKAITPGFYLSGIIKFIFCFSLLIIPSSLIGGTLPVAGKYFMRLLNIDYNTIKEIFHNPLIANDLKKLDIVDPHSFLGCFVAGGRELKKMIGESIVNTDNHMQIKLLRRNLDYTRKSATELLKIFLNHRHSITYLVKTENTTIKEKIDNHFQATHYTIAGNICYVVGMFDLLNNAGADKQVDYYDIYTRYSYTKTKLINAVTEYRKALSIVPEDKYTERLFRDAAINLKYTYLALSMTCRKMGNHEKAKHFYYEAQSIK